MPEPGEHASRTYTVGDDDTAAALGSGDLAVLGTPRLLAWCEAQTLAAVAAGLPEASTTVGTRISVEHRHASTVGERVEVSARLVLVDGRTLHFEVVATDDRGRQVGHAEVTRTVVGRERFLSRLG